MTGGADRHLLEDVLAPVSRAFYLTIRILPRASRLPIGLAYLLARTADTIADTQALSAQDRERKLIELEGALRERPRQVPRFDLEAPDPHERRLLGALPQALDLYYRLPAGERDPISRVVATLISGMRFDLDKFPPQQGRVSSLTSSDELENYIYLVAGCVGEFWTEVMHRQHGLFPAAALADTQRRGVNFGKALQLTNVLRDAPRDLDSGRCYLPSHQLETWGLQPADLMREGGARQAWAVYREWLLKALEYYEDAIVYACRVPVSHLRLRLAVIWPISIGLETLRLWTVQSGWMPGRAPSKVSRPWIYKMLVVSLPLALTNTTLRWALKRMRRNVDAAIRATDAGFDGPAVLPG